MNFKTNNNKETKFQEDLLNRSSINGLEPFNFNLSLSLSLSLSVSLTHSLLKWFYFFSFFGWEIKQWELKYFNIAQRIKIIKIIIKILNFFLKKKNLKRNCRKEMVIGGQVIGQLHSDFRGTMGHSLTILFCFLFLTPKFLIFSQKLYIKINDFL